jgi:hypothetical protein
MVPPPAGNPNKPMNYALLAVLTLWSLLLPGPAQLAPAQVRPEQAAYEVAPGAETTIVVLLENAANVYGIDIRAAYDPALVEVVDADPSRDGVQVQPGNLPQPDFVARQSVDPAAGTIHYVVTQVNPTPPANGDGVAFTVRLRGRGVPGAGEFRIDLVEMSTRDGELLPVQWGTATLQVAGGAADAAAQPTGIALGPTAAAQQPAASPTPIGSAATPTAPAAPAATAANAPAATQAAPPATGATTATAAPPAPGADANAPSADTNAPAIDPAAPPADEPAPAAAPPATAAPAATAAESVAGVAPAPDRPVTSDEIAVAPAVIGDGRPSGNANTAAAPDAAASDDGGTSPWPLVLVLGVVLVAGAALLLARRSPG